MAGGEEVEEDLLVGWVGAVVVGEVHAAAELGADGVGHDGRHLGRVGGEDYGGVGYEVGAVAGGLGLANAMTGEVVVGEAEEVVWVVDGDGADVILDGATEGHGELSHAVGEGADAIAGGLVFVNTGEAVAEEDAVEVVEGGGVGGGWVLRERGVEVCEGLVDIAVKGEGDALGTDDLREILGGIADVGEWMDHEHDAALGAGHAEVPAGAVVGDEGVREGAGGGDGEELGDGGAGGSEVVLDPGVGGVCGGEAGPDVEGIGEGGSGGVRGLGIFCNCLHGGDVS